MALFTIIVVLLFNFTEIVKSSPMFFGYRGEDLFGVYTARLDGSEFRRLFTDSTREMTHVRLSPDGRHLTFTRYNKLLKDGIAEENGSGYAHTEVLVANADGSNPRSVSPSGPEKMNANSSWIDNDTIIFIHIPNLKTSLPELRTFSISTNQTNRIPTPKGFAVSDPSYCNNMVVFPVVPLSPDPKVCDTLWRMRIDGSDLQQLTRPNIVPTSKRLDFKVGDYDPWFSPDGKTIVFMRYFGGEDWRIYSIGVDGRNEQELTRKGIPSGIPKWSSDGKLIVYVCWDKSKLENLGLYTMNPTGSNNQQIPLPGGYLYTHPNIFPNGGSLSDSRIIFSARRVPSLPGKAKQQ